MVECTVVECTVVECTVVECTVVQCTVVECTVEECTVVSKQPYSCTCTQQLHTTIKSGRQRKATRAAGTMCHNLKLIMLLIVHTGRVTSW